MEAGKEFQFPEVIGTNVLANEVVRFINQISIIIFNILHLILLRLQLMTRDLITGNMREELIVVCITYVYTSDVRSMDAVDAAHPANFKMSRVFSSVLYSKICKILKTLSINTIQLIIHLKLYKIKICGAF